MTSSTSDNKKFEHTDFQEEEVRQRLKGDVVFADVDIEFPSVPFEVNAIKLKKKQKTIIRRKNDGTDASPLF